MFLAAMSGSLPDRKTTEPPPRIASSKTPDPSDARRSHAAPLRRFPPRVRVAPHPTVRVVHAPRAVVVLAHLDADFLQRRVGGAHPGGVRARVLILTRLPPVGSRLASRRAKTEDAPNQHQLTRRCAKKPRDARRGSASPGPTRTGTRRHQHQLTRRGDVRHDGGEVIRGLEEDGAPRLRRRAAPTLARRDPRAEGTPSRGRTPAGDHARNRRALHQRIDGVRDGTVGVDPPAGGVQRGSRARRLGGDVESVVLESEGRDVERKASSAFHASTAVGGGWRKETREGARGGERREEGTREGERRGERRDRRCRPEMFVRRTNLGCTGRPCAP